MVNHCAQVELHVLKLVESKRPVASVRPEVVPLEPLQDFEPKCLRPTSRRRVPRHPPGPGRAPLQNIAPPALDDGVDARSESSGEEATHGADDEEATDPEFAALLEEARAVDLGADADEPAGRPAGVPEDSATLAVARLAHEPAPAVAEPPAAAAGAPEVPPPPPPLPGRRKHATVTLHMPGGSVSFYESKGAFEAVCENIAHGRCVVTRTCKGRGVASTGFPRGGRPVGFLAAWLARGELLATKEDHWAAGVFEIPQHEREAVRTAIRDCGASGQTLLSCERGPAAGEPAEPPTLEGYYP